MTNEYVVGINYTPDVKDRKGLTDRTVFEELNILCARYRNGSVCRGWNMTESKSDEDFCFFDLEGALGFIRDTIDKSYVSSQSLGKS